MRKSKDPKILQKKAEIKARTGLVETKDIEKSEDAKGKKLEMFFKFNNIEKKGDAREVWGIASAEIVDTTGDVVLHSAMKAAWVEYIQYGNIREMHQPSAVGTIIESQFLEAEKSTFIKVKVVDDNAWEKVKTGVYKGFSIGAMIEDASWDIVDGDEVFVIKKIKLVEISLVDRPANQNSNIDGFKFISLTNENMSKGFLAKFMSGKTEVEKKADDVETKEVETPEVIKSEVEKENIEAPKDDIDVSANEEENIEEEKKEDEVKEEEEEEKVEEVIEEEVEKEEETIEVSKKSLDALLEKVTSLEVSLEKVLSFNDKLVKGLDATFTEHNTKVDEMNKSLKVLSTSKRSVQKDIIPENTLNKTSEVSFQSIFGNGGSM